MSFLQNSSDTGSSDSSSITFLFKLVGGISPGSFGLNVARIAGVPRALIERAAAVSEEYQAQQHGTSSSVAPEARARLTETLVQEILASTTGKDDKTSLLAPAERVRAAWLSAQRLVALAKPASASTQE